ncbi:phage tail assembly protein [Endozoicomonas sp. SM1973]|uniref:Phage tail assembly protein n=1 Tax=Spartinivicinus marinus TaxID=2994442 RepID=A0A853I978_9GAMM|nr:phage tail assembly protein [Spartinivicinus marinus]MCX4025038.1 phage tail assembly protein [Spartinivicinus marinus]MCX4027835.1 phage tail assembly protein [Spartinivicinus marinus]NYZ70450.1 phage tail assembly protein [Spartinivicinus marinus]
MSELITLNYPIERNGEVINEVTLRRPKTKDMKNIEKRGGGEISQSIHMIADLSGLDIKTIEELDAADFQRLNDVVAGFLDSTGDRSSKSA